MGSASDVVSVTCDCGKRLKAPASAAGKRARCPACGTVHVMPYPDEALEPVPQQVGRSAAAPAGRAAVDPFEASDAPPEDEDPFDAMYKLAQQEEENAPPASSAVHCPQCRRLMPDGAVLCVNCGYDSRTGKSAAAAASVSPAVPRMPLPTGGKKSSKKVDYMAPTGSLVLGIVFSAVAALLASLVWIGIAYATGYTIGYIAILIGIAAGVGMQAGHGGQSAIGGSLAGAMTLVAIFVAKVVVLYATLAKLGYHGSLWDLDSAKLGMYFFSPIGLIIIVIGIGAAYRTASGAITD